MTSFRTVLRTEKIKLLPEIFAFASPRRVRARMEIMHAPMNLIKSSLVKGMRMMNERSGALPKSSNVMKVIKLLFHGFFSSGGTNPF